MTFNEAEAQLVDAVKYGFLSMRIDHRNGTLHFGGQQLESDRVRGHLALLAKRLAKASSMIDPRPAVGRAEEGRRAALALCRDHMASEHKRLLARKLLIEKRKEQQEAALLEAEREEERRRQQVGAGRRHGRGGFLVGLMLPWRGGLAVVVAAWRMAGRGYLSGGV
jgi:translation initiation factor 3 subunit A